MATNTTSWPVFKRALFAAILVGAYVYGGRAGAIDFLCCQCATSHGPNATVIWPQQSCQAACERQQQGAKVISSSIVGDASACQARGAPRSVAPDSYSLEDLKREIEYAIYHQGANIWRPSGPLKGEELRRALTGVDARHEEINNASVERLENGTTLALNQCIAEKDIAPDLHWVCEHEGQAGDIINRARQGNFDAVRSVFSNYQKHDDTLRNRIYCVSNERLNQMVTNQCTAPPPVQQQTVGRPEHDHNGDHGQGASGR